MKKPKLEKIQKERLEKIYHLCSLFNLNGRKLSDIITDGQLHIFNSIVFRDHKRVEIICSTQYGKSLITACACLILTAVMGETVAILAPSNNKAKIIMRYYIKHIGDDPLFYSQLEKNTRLERLRQEDSKERIVLRNGGGIFVLSAQQRNVSKSIESAMGEGAENVIIDEACLIRDETEATIYRMLAGKGEGAFYCKIGNPFYSDPPFSHFKESWESPSYHKIFIDYKQALKEGRYPQDFIEDARKKPLFDVLFGCEFPADDLIDDKGFRKLLSSSDIKYIDELGDIDGETKLGCDIGGGGDYNVYTLRVGNRACIVGRNRADDTMVNVAEIRRLMSEYNVKPENVFIDDIGIGRGVTDRLKELGFDVNGVSVGEKANDKETFYNLKAELYWDLAKWIKGGGRLVKHDGWVELLWIKYKEDSERRVKIESKESLRKRIDKSPDHAESLMLTFYKRPSAGIINL